MGIVDVLATDGQGETAVRNWIAKNAKRRNGLQAVHRARQFIHPVTREELDGIVELWVDAALRLGERDLKMMNRLVRAQMRRMEARTAGGGSNVHGDAAGRAARRGRHRLPMQRSLTARSAGSARAAPAGAATGPPRRGARRSRSGRCGGYPHRPGCTRCAGAERASGSKDSRRFVPAAVANASSLTETSSAGRCSAAQRSSSVCTRS